MRLRLSTKVSLILLLLFASMTASAQQPELVVQAGHNSWISSVVFSPDGKTLASAGADNTIKLWDVVTGRELRTLRDSWMVVGFSRDGKVLATMGTRGAIKLLDVANGLELKTINVENATPISSFALSSDGKIMATGTKDQTIKLWDAATGRELRTLKGRAGSELSLSFSADGTMLASGSGDKTIKLWDVATGQELHTIKAQHRFNVHAVLFSGDGKILASQGDEDNTIKLWDVATGKELRTLTGHPHQNPAMAFSHDSKMLATGSMTGTIQLWDVATGTELRTLTGHSFYILTVAFSADGKTLASGGMDKTINLWDPSNGRKIRTLMSRSAFVTSVAISPDGRMLVGGEADGVIKLWDLSTGQLVRTITAYKVNPFAEVFHSLNLPVVFSPDGRILASGGTAVKLWDVATGRELRTLKGHSDWITCVAFSGDGKTVASGSLDKTIKRWEVATGRELSPLVYSKVTYSMTFDGVRQVYKETARHSSISSIVFARRGQMMASGGDTIKMWNNATGRELWTAKGYGRQVNSLAFSKDDRMLASGSDEAIKVWDVATGRQLRTLKGPTSESVALNKDGKTLTSREIDKIIKSLDIARSVAFSRDGKTLATGSVVGTIKFWNVATGDEQRKLYGQYWPVMSIAFSGDDKLLASGSLNIKLWEATTGKELATLISLDDKDWLVVTPDGFFDGTAAAWRQLIWRFNNNTFDNVPVEAFYNEFYYPGLLADLMAGKRPTAPQGKEISQKDRRQIPVTLSTTEKIEPKASVKSSTVALRVEVEEAPGGPDISDKDKLLPPSGARDVRLFRNGSLVKLWKGDTFSLSEKDGCRVQLPASPQNPRRSTCTATVPIVAGENHFTAYAFNNDNVKSLDADMTPINGDESLKRPATLYVLAIGVGQNSNPNFRLNYAARDAQAFEEQIKAQQQNIGRYARTETTRLADEKATRENILSELRRLSALVRPDDALIIYFSGHGTAQEKHFYMLPYDIGYQGPRTKEAIDSGNNLAEILSHSVSDEDLEQVLRAADAGQIVLVIDACNSGQALNADDPRRGPMNSTGLAQLAYEKGMYILTASQDFELAYESDALKHSYLTYSLIEEALKAKTKDADADKDGQIDLREWFNYAVEEVPRLRQRKVEQGIEKLSRRLAGKGRAAKSKALEEVEVGKVQQPRVFYRREADARPLIVANVGASK